MLQLLSGNPRTVDALGFLLAFALTALMDSVFHDKLPHDHGRAFAVNGELSKGKARGSGLIFVLCIALVTLAVVPFKAEYVIYTVLLIASMLSGYFDDAAETAWNEYKKGLIDLVIAVVAGVTYLNFNGTEVNFLSWSFSLPYAVYLILIIVLIWASINVVNCTDGVDGLSASLAVVSIGTFLLAYWEELGDYATAGIVFIGALLAYLWQNAKPSTLLMGDAGSRAMGFFLAVLALKSSHPFAFLLAALVFIVDGSLGILKISFKRFLHISILKNTLTPLHDHVRKRLGWSDEQVVARWLILQAVAAAWLLLVAAHLRRGERSWNTPGVAPVMLALYSYLAQAVVSIRVSMVFPLVMLLFGALAALTAPGLPQPAAPAPRGKKQQKPEPLPPKNAWYFAKTVLAAVLCMAAASGIAPLLFGFLMG